MKTFEEVYTTLPADGWLTEDEARLLWDKASLYDGPILEVGCYKGRSTVLLASLGRPVYAVDPFAGFSTDDPSGEGVKAEWMGNVYSRGLSDVVQLFHRRVEDWAARPAGFAYLDGDHTYTGTLAQIRAALSCGARGVAAHDFNETGGGAEVRRACLQKLGTPAAQAGRLAYWGTL